MFRTRKLCWRFCRLFRARCFTWSVGRVAAWISRRRSYRWNACWKACWIACCATFSRERARRRSRGFSRDFRRFAGRRCCWVTARRFRRESRSWIIRTTSSWTTCCWCFARFTCWRVRTRKSGKTPRAWLSCRTWSRALNWLPSRLVIFDRRRRSCLSCRITDSDRRNRICCGNNRRLGG